MPRHFQRQVTRLVTIQIVVDFEIIHDTIEPPIPRPAITDNIRVCVIQWYAARGAHLRHDLRDAVHIEGRLVRRRGGGIDHRNVMPHVEAGGVNRPNASTGRPHANVLEHTAIFGEILDFRSVRTLIENPAKTAPACPLNINPR